MEWAQYNTGLNSKRAIVFNLSKLWGSLQFDPLLAEAGSNAFTMSPTRWGELTSAIGIITKNGAGVPQGERLVKLNLIAIQQMQVLEGNSGRNLLK